MNKIIKGDCIKELKNLEENSIDSIVTDPPYGLEFMGKNWDKGVPGIEFWKEMIRVIKPGGFLLSFGGTRTYHRMACAIEDAGFEIRDCILWIYGSGFPKSLNIHKKDKRCPEGWGTALKPAVEPIVVARKPLSEKSVALNVLKWGTGGINIDESRVGTETISIHNAPKGTFAGGEPDRGSDTESYRNSVGRFPANLIHDNSQEVRECFPDTKSCMGNPNKQKNINTNINFNGRAISVPGVNQFGDSGNASRFFKSIIYQAKASKAERNKGLEGFEEKRLNYMAKANGTGEASMDSFSSLSKNNHPTVKPVKLMQYLVRMVTPKNGTVLDPFMGSGTTGIGAKLEGFNFIGIEKEEEYIKIAEARIKAWGKQKTLF